MNLNDIVKSNEEILQLIEKDHPGRLNMYIGTLDTAMSRLNTTLIKLSQDKVLEQEHTAEVVDCQEAIQSFYKNTLRLRDWHWITRPLIKLILHGIGTRKIPKIKRLYNKVITNDESGRN
jgi:hypothetical protein|tara:strand:- start:2304 stop:2663 length:360 start_codon:yes stop_codon:yes gene_type:complete